MTVSDNDVCVAVPLSEKVLVTPNFDATKRALACIVIGTAALTACGSTVDSTSVTGAATSSGDSLGLDVGSSTTAPDASALQQPTAAGGLPAEGAGSETSTAPTESATTAAGSGTGGATGTTGSGSSIALTGPGWDAKNIYIGFSTLEDISKIAGSLGVAFDPGSIQADVKALVADVNRKGGLFGRTLVPIFQDNKTSEISSSPANAAQKNCETFTQDHHVIAVFQPVAGIDTEALRECMRKAKTPLFGFGYNTYDSQIYREAGPYLFTLFMPSLDKVVPAWITGLKRQSYFTPWNNGTAGPKAPVKVGILQPDTPIGTRTATMMRNELRKAGVTVGGEYSYAENTGSYTNDMSSAVLKFRAAGVTHVMNLSNVAAAWYFFGLAANQQNYHPRYGITTFNLAQLATKNIAKQLEGSVGIGWLPGSDVSTGNQLPDNATAKQCLAALAKGDQTFNGQRTYAKFVGLALCDGLRMFVAGMTRTGGLLPDLLSAGVTGLGKSFPLASTFVNGLSPSNHGTPGSVRDFYFKSDCKCYAYRSTTSYPL